MSVALPMMLAPHFWHKHGSNLDLKSEIIVIKSLATFPAGFTDEVPVLTVENMLRWNYFFKTFREKKIPLRPWSDNEIFCSHFIFHLNSCLRWINCLLPLTELRLKRITPDIQT